LQRFSNWHMSSSLALGPASSWMLFSPRHLRGKTIVMDNLKRLWLSLASKPWSCGVINLEP
jgi:hypothetical protein